MGLLAICVQENRMAIFFEESGVVLIQEGDLLVTTGMDSLFPPNLPVAFVSKVKLLKEGDASFSIEAKLHATSIDDFSSCTILPSLGMVPGCDL